MTNDELLAGYLDRSLSEDQLIELEARRNAEPAFAQEANEMLTVEKLLVLATPVVTPPVDFLSSVESTMAAKVAAGSSAGGFFSGLASSAWTWIAGACVVVVGGYYVATLESLRSESAQPATTPTIISTPSLTTPESSAPADEITKPQIKSNSTSPTPTPVSNPTKSVSTPDPKTAPTSVDMTTKNSDRALEALVKDLQACRASGDHVRCSQIALNVGRAYRMRGSINDAEENFTLALSEAQIARLVQFEIEANGELGVTAQQQGRHSDAKERFSQAVALGQRNGIPTEKWAKALREIEK